MFLDPDLPDELQGGGTRTSDFRVSEDKEELLANLGLTVATMRDEAVKGRKATGIEEVWAACEDAYLGIDDSNRHEFAKAQWAKPTSMTGPVTSNAAPRNDGRSTAFVRLTSRYVDMGAAKICEITLPVDDKAFSLSPTPVPDLINHKDNKTPLTNPQGQAVMRPEGQAQDGQPAPMVQATVADLAKLDMDAASKAAEKAETRIYDWMVEANYPAEMRTVIADAARIGVGVLKCPFPQIKTSFARENGKLKQRRTVSPGMRRVSPWNVYPDPACGENIHDGDYVFESDKLTPAKLKALKRELLKDGQPIYIHSQIDKVLAEGPNKCFADGARETNTKQYQIWYFTGTIKRGDMALMGAVGADDLPDDVVDVNAIVTLVNDSVIRATINPLESGEFPYRTMAWSRREGSWAGVGPGEQVSMPQKMVNAATRALLNNAGQSAGAQTVIDQRSITPADGKWAMTPNKFWYLTDNASTDDVRKIFMSVALPNLGDQLMKVIEYAFKLAEEATNIPLVTQGRGGPSSPETFGAAELQDSNAHTLLRSVAYTLDDSITAPVVKDLYEWLLLDDDIPEEEKGDFQINAKGSIAMVEKAIQEQTLMQMFALSKDPAYGLNPKKLMEEVLKAKRLDQRKLGYSDDELAELAKRPPPEAPVITAAKIRAASSEKVAVGHDQATVEKMKVDTDRDRVYNEVMAKRTENDYTATMAELQLREKLAMLDYANKNQITLDELKTKLADTAMRLNVQKELSRDALQVDVHKHQNPSPITPPTEPVGRAKSGLAYEQ